MIMAGISPHKEPSARGMPRKKKKLRAYPGCRMMA
jgi:hypothetical protein